MKRERMLPVVSAIAIIALSANNIYGYDVTVSGLYPTTVKVISVEEETIDIITDYVITGMDCEGRMFSWYDSAEDIYVDDLMALIMDDNGTPSYVYDDMVISARYVGIAEWFM